MGRHDAFNPSSAKFRRKTLTLGSPVACLIAGAIFVANLLDMSRIEAGGLKVNRDLVSIADVVQGAVERSRKALPGQSVRVSLAPNLPFVRGDDKLLEQVLFNLLDNAHKYAGDAGAIVHARHGIVGFDHQGRVRVRNRLSIPSLGWGSATQAGSSFDRVASFTMRSPPTRGKQRLPLSDFMRRLHLERTFRLDSLRGPAQNRREMEKTLMRVIFDNFNVITIFCDVITIFFDVIKIYFNVMSSNRWVCLLGVAGGRPRLQQRLCSRLPKRC